jgi:hypothetical protein
VPMSGFIDQVDDWLDHEPLLEWLGISPVEAHRIFWTLEGTIDDFKRWHKAGKVS